MASSLAATVGGPQLDFVLLVEHALVHAQHGPLERGHFGGSFLGLAGQLGRAHPRGEALAFPRGQLPACPYFESGIQCLKAE